MFKQKSRLLAEEFAMIQSFLGLLLLVAYFAYLFSRAPNAAAQPAAKKPFVYDPDYVAAFLQREQRRYQAMRERRQAEIEEGNWTRGEEELYQAFFAYKLDYDGPMFDGDPMYGMARRA